MDHVSLPGDAHSPQLDSPKAQTNKQQKSGGLVPSHGISIDIQPPKSSDSSKPSLVSHVSSPAYESPLRHHRRTPSAPRHVKESLNARSEYITSQDDGSAQHRINQYIIKQEIGRGSFGAVHLAVDHDGEEYAVKEFSKSRLRKRAQSHILRGPRAHRQRGNLSPEDFNSPLHRNPANDPTINKQSLNSIDLIREEIAIMKKLNHPNLVSLIEVLDDPTQDSLYMVLEMCKKGVVMKVGLGETADPYSEEQCRCWLRDLILGIEYLHAQGIVHRDIKPDNCLLTKDDVLKVVDFGVSEMFEKDSEMLTAKSAGSPAFLPPELCVVRHGGISGKAVDIWSMGVTLYCLRFGRIPFERSGILDMYEAIKSENVAVPSGCGEDFEDLMRRILEKDPAKRIKMSELREHPWVTRNGADPLLSYEENTSELVEPPTEEEVNRAITGNMQNLITVMKAVHKFKALTAHKRPPVMSSILGDEGTHYTQPPLSMKLERPAPSQIQHKSHSLDVHDRRPVEGALATEGVHHPIDSPLPTRGGRYPQDRNLGKENNTESGIGNGSIIASTENTTGLLRQSPAPSELVSDDSGGFATPTGDGGSFPPFVRSDLLLPPTADIERRAQTAHEIGSRGHARDPLEDRLYLFIGPSTYSGVSDAQDRRASFVPDENDIPIVSESPGAADIDIYETAYRDEIERIRARLSKEAKEDEEPVVFLTRRVDAKLVALGGLAGRMLAYGEEGIDKVKDLKGLKEGRVRVSGISRALRAAAREEYERLKQERRARETVEAAKAETIKVDTGSSTAADTELVQSPTELKGEEFSPMIKDDNDSDDRPVATRSTPSLFSSMSPLAGKAWEKGKQAKTSFKGFYERARELGSRHSSQSEHGG